MASTSARTRLGRTLAGLVGGAGLAAWSVTASAAGAPARPAPRLAQTEQLFADWLDSGYARSTLAAGPMTRLDGRSLADWTARREVLAHRLSVQLDRLSEQGLDPTQARALKRMRRVLADAPEAPASSPTEEFAARCESAGDAGLDRPALSRALYGCFEHYGNHIPFEGRAIARTTALELLQQIDSSARRRALFDALAPLWIRINAHDEAASPYRRLIRLSSAEAQARGGSEVARAALTLGETPDQAETQLVAVLEAWRKVNPGPPMEPWDYWRHYSEGVSALDTLIPPERIPGLCARYYRDLGFDLDRSGVIQDLAVRPGKAPLAYTDFARIGRQGPRGWRPAKVRVSANVERGGLFVLNEIVHEDGHAMHMMAVRAQPAYFDLGDDLFIEAFADVTSWSVAEPRWQSRYLGKNIDGPVARRALLANVMLDVAWGLFELRMLRDADADPNLVWTEITNHYLNILPHPELAWWALRVQLVDEPGYMINYGLGAILTADLRDRFHRAVGDFDAGNPRFYSYAAAHLLKSGAAVETPDLLRSFLGRPVSTAPLLAEISRLEASRGLAQSQQRISP
jgi:hypothetical protein